MQSIALELLQFKKKAGGKSQYWVGRTNFKPNYSNRSNGIEPLDPESKDKVVPESDVGLDEDSE